jgi:hypothetical protein
MSTMYVIFFSMVTPVLGVFGSIIYFVLLRFISKKNLFFKYLLILNNSKESLRVLGSLGFHNQTILLWTFIKKMIQIHGSAFKYLQLIKFLFKLFHLL